MNSHSQTPPNDPPKGGGNKPDYFLVVIVNGVPVEIPTNPNAALVSVIAKALSESNNSGLPPENWILTTEAGKKLEPTDKPAALGLASGTKLFLNLKAGVGGQR